MGREQHEIHRPNLVQTTAKKDPSTYEPWMKALICAAGQTCNWTDKKYLTPLLDYLGE